MTTAAYLTENAPDQIRSIYSQFGSFCQGRGGDADPGARASIIEQLLLNVLGWPSEGVVLDPVNRPAILDYELRVPLPVIVLETRAAGPCFTIKHQKRAGSRRLRLSGALRTNKELWNAILSAQRQCVDHGARYAVATNGYSFVIFQALTEGRSWRSEFAVVFTGPKDIEHDFATFWNLLSYESVSTGGLDNHFRGTDTVPREYHVPIASLLEADATYGRNPYTVALHPYVERFFGDIGSLDTVDVLDHCYIYSKPTQVIDSELRLVINDHTHPGSRLALSRC